MTVVQLVLWAAMMAGMLACYASVVGQTSSTPNGEGQLAGMLWLIMMLPVAFVGVVQLLVWWLALRSWRRREVDATIKIRVAAVFTATVPVLLAFAPKWWLPHWVYVLTALAAIGALALVAAWTAHTPEVTAHLTEPPRRLRTAPVTNWTPPTRRS
ncbi:hypothetical protein [Kitasatospora sp. LaBMicrA B282]|uniref:hypothetical protein n=1 Tax=Kitasatospora sp. LaBMicrA B282 TaxID=3420949 RepID=UPI003D0F6EC7